MPNELVDVQLIAELTIDAKVEKVSITALSLKSCVARVPFKIKRFQPALLRLFEDKGNGELTPFNGFKTIIESYSQKKDDPNAYYANIKFNGMVKANYGVIQSLHAAKRPVEQKIDTTLRAKNNSLRAITVQCYLCGHKPIPFWSLQPRCMVTKNNIFGVPIYIENYPKRDFCDFNFIRIVVCPSCYFASSELNDFKRDNDKQEITPPTFDVATMPARWNEKLSERKSLTKSQLSEFFGEERTLEQAILSYDLAVLTSDEIFKADDGTDPRHRDFSSARKSIYYRLYQAELLMANERVQDAQNALQDANQRLEDIFLYLRHEPSVKVGYLLGMINMYFGNNKKVGQYMVFLQTYNKNNTVKPDSNEYKTLESCIKKLSEANQTREEYFKDNLKGFKKPF